MTKDNKPELAACLHCGGKAMEDFTFVGKREETKHYIFCQGCGAQTGLYKTQAEAITAWSKRYVCNDKHGKPVYAGDEVKFRIWDEAPTGEFRVCRVLPHRAEQLRYGYGLVGGNDFWTDIFRQDQIELIQENQNGKI